MNDNYHFSELDRNLCFVDGNASTMTMFSILDKEFPNTIPFGLTFYFNDIVYCVKEEPKADAFNKLFKMDESYFVRAAGYYRFSTLHKGLFRNGLDFVVKKKDGKVFKLKCDIL